MRRALALALLAAGAPIAGPAAPAPPVTPEERQRIEQAAPDRALAAAAKPRSLLVFMLNVGYGGHPSAAHAAEAFQLMGRRTGAFRTVVSQDPAVFRAESLREFDAVCFNNTVGNLFTDPAWRRSLVEFVVRGGGLMGMHGTSVAFTRWPGAIEDWPEFGVMLGARGASHRESDEHVFLKLDDPAHPLTRMFPEAGFDRRDEFFRFGEPYSRHRVRVLLSFDTARTDLDQGAARGTCLRPDDDYAVAWIRRYGRGRTFYCSMAHHPALFWDARLLTFYLGAIQFVLGDLEAPTTPSARLTPAVRSQEALGWRVGIQASGRSPSTWFEAVDFAAGLGATAFGSWDAPRVAADLDRPFGPGLTDADLSRVRMKLDAAGLACLTHRVTQPPADEAGWRGLFVLARQLGVEALVATPPPERLARLGALCDEFDVSLAVPLDPAAGHAPYRGVADFLRAVGALSPRLGVHAELAAWSRAGWEPRATLGAIGRRLITLQLEEGDGLAPATAGVLAELRSLRIRPVMVGVAMRGEAPDAAGRGLESLNALTLTLSPP